MTLSLTFSIMALELCYAKCPLCRISPLMLSVIILNVKLSVIILGAVMLNVAMLSVEVPSCKQS